MTHALRAGLLTYAGIFGFACSGQTVTPGAAGASGGGSGGAGSTGGASTVIVASGNASGTAGMTGTAGIETGNDALNGVFGSSGATVAGSGATGGAGGTGANGVTGMSGSVPIACDAGPPEGPACPPGTMSIVEVDGVYGQCFAVYTCSPIAYCTQGASCTPGSGNCGYGAAGCGNTCTCNSAGLYDHCTNDCSSGVTTIGRDAAANDDATVASDAGGARDAVSDAPVDALQSLDASAAD